MERIVFITGATSGIGKACAEKFASEGDHIILTGRRTERLQVLKDELELRYKIKAFTLSFDVQDRLAVFAAVDQLPEEWRAIDILINNAGLALGRDYFEEANLDDWDTMLQTNVNGIIYTTRAVLPLMIPRFRGHIINIGSTAAKEVYEKGNIYCVSKHAVDAVSQSMRIDLLRHGIKVTAVHPGAAETEFSLVRFKGDQVKAGGVYEGFQPLSGTDIAETIYYCTNLPAHVCINDLVMTSISQANSFYLHKE